MEELLTQRWDMGLGNPNKAGAVLACALVLVWCLASRWKNLATILALLLAGGLAWTGSRGGLVAALVGMSVVAASAMWQREMGVMKRIAFVMLVAVGVMFLLPQSSRESRSSLAGTEDYSLTNRWQIYKAVPAMIMAAPHGWGWGRSGDAYMQWFQEKGRLENYRTLVSTHATILVEGDWAVRLAYTMLWGVALGIGMSGLRGKHKLSAASRLGSLVAFGVACAFSTVGETLWCWLLPVFVLIFSLGVALRNESFADIAKRLWVPVFLAFWVLAVIAIIGLIPRGARVRCVAPGWVRLGVPLSYDYLVLHHPDRAVLGDHYGHALRSWCERTGSPTLVIDSLAEKSTSYTQGVVAVFPGQLPDDSIRAKSILMLNPPRPDKQTVAKLAQANEWAVVLGENVDWKTHEAWQGLKTDKAQLHEVAGCATYLPQWTPFLDLWK